MKPSSTVGDLLEGPTLPGGVPVYVCQECVELCSSIFQHRKMYGDAAGQIGESPIDEATQQLLREKIDQVFSVLTGLESDILRLRYGLIDGYTYTLEQIGKRVGLKPEQVADIEASAMCKLPRSGRPE
jgi:DNA-directed RNA polymerase sigma subunit (sigma70/sigma32)